MDGPVGFWDNGAVLARFRAGGVGVGIGLLACCGALGYTAAGLAASETAMGKPAVTQAQMAELEADINNAINHQLQAAIQLKKAAKLPQGTKGLKAAQKSALANIHQAQLTVTAALTLLAGAGFRDDQSYKTLARAGSALAAAFASNLWKNKLTYLQATLPVEKSALTLIAGLPLASSSATTTNQTQTTTTSG